MLQKYFIVIFEINSNYISIVRYIKHEMCAAAADDTTNKSRPQSPGRLVIATSNTLRLHVGLYTLAMTYDSCY